jgi:hypothetical protein
MRTRLAVPLTALCILAALGAGRKGPKAEKPDPSQANDQPLPAPVQATVDQHLPGSKVTGYEHEADQGRQLFFVDVTTDAGKSVTLLASGRGQYLGQVIENDQDDNDVFIDLATAPDPVRKAIAKQFKADDAEKADLDNLFMEVEESRFMFIAEHSKDDITTWATFALNGALVSLETEVPLKDLPAAVKDAISMGRPAAKLTSATTTDDKEKKKTFFTVDVTDGPSKLQITLSPDGKIDTTEPAEDEPATKPG